MEIGLIGLDLVVIGDAGIVGFYLQASVLPDGLNHVLDRLSREGTSLLITV